MTGCMICAGLCEPVRGLGGAARDCINLRVFVEGRAEPIWIYVGFEGSGWGFMVVCGVSHMFTCGCYGCVRLWAVKGNVCVCL